MQLFFNIVLTAAIIVAVVFSALIFFTSKGDAMGGSSGVRTSFKGKAGFEDYMSIATLYLGVSFMVLTLVLDILNNQITKKGG